MVDKGIATAGKEIKIFDHCGSELAHGSEGPFEPLAAIRICLGLLLLIRKVVRNSTESG